MTPHVIEILMLFIGLLLAVLQTMAIMLFKQQGRKLEAFCANNEKEHDKIWSHVNHHKHTINGEVVIPMVSVNLKEE
jgi:hypothetical protein